jgi:hypothetical protein
MSDLLPYVQLVAGTDKGFVDAADRQESVLLTGERGDIRGEQRSVEAYYLQRTRIENIADRKIAPAPVDRGWECQDQQAVLRPSER